MADNVEKATRSDAVKIASNLSEQRFDRMISEVEDYAIILLDRDGIICTWNKGAQKIKGYTADEIIGKSYLVFYPLEDHKRELPKLLLQRATEEGKANHEGWRVRKDGTRFWSSVVITAIHGDDGNVNGFLKVTRDLTERKIAEDKFGNYVEELRFKNQELQKAEERYHKMVSEVNDYAIILLDVDGRILDWNKGAQKLKGYRAEEIVGKSFRLFYPMEDKETNLPERLLAEALKNGFANNEGYRIRKDGTRFWGNVAITALYDDNGNHIGFSKVTKDLSDRKIAEDRINIVAHELKVKNDALTESEERYHRMIAEVQDYAILLLDKNGDIQNWNAGAEKIKGYNAKEVVGKNFRIFYLPDDIKLGLPTQLLDEALANGKATNEGWRKRKDGTKFWASIVITALHNSNGELIGYSKVTRDLTDRKKADDDLRNKSLELELKNHDLEKLNAELASFAYVVSHDFKEPIRKIQIFGKRQLEEGKTIDEILGYSAKIISSAERMQNLMQALLSYSMISNDPSVPEPVDLNAIVSAMIVDLEVVIAESHAEIVVSDLPKVTGIAYQLSQLFLNLVLNSVKFAKPGEPPSVSISCREVSQAEMPVELLMKNRSFYKISFQDKGIGFDPEQANRIFDVFQRLQTNVAAGGTGIGLAIVKRVTSNHDGLVVADSTPGMGAVFEVYLPK